MRQPEHWRKRCKRVDEPGHAHYLTFSCFGRQPFLTGDRARAWLIESINQARLKHPFDLWAWIFMPEHVHLLLLPKAGSTISAILKAIKQPVTLAAVRYVKTSSPAFLARMRDSQPNGRYTHRFWQRGGGYDRNIWSTQEVHEKIEYIHANPVKRGLTSSPADWPWSSWRAWTQGVDEPLRIDRDSVPTIRHLGA